MLQKVRLQHECHIYQGGSKRTLVINPSSSRFLSLSALLGFSSWIPDQQPRLLGLILFPSCSEHTQSIGRSLELHINCYFWKLVICSKHTLHNIIFHMDGVITIWQNVPYSTTTHDVRQYPIRQWYLMCVRVILMFPVLCNYWLIYLFFYHCIDWTQRHQYFRADLNYVWTIKMIF